MSISENIRDKLNSQINLEFESAYLYLGMAAWFEQNKLPGFGSWMRLQAEEELRHGMRIYAYMSEQGSMTRLRDLSAPQQDWKSGLEIVKAALVHEQKVTRSIHAIVDEAETTKDHATVSMLRWFVDEQVEEEATLGDIIDRLQLAGDGSGLLIIDAELAKRPENQA